MLHFRSSYAAWLPNPLRVLLRHTFSEAERRGTFAVGPISWLPRAGVFEDMVFHQNDGPYHFETAPTGGREFGPGYDRGRVLFSPAFTVFHPATGEHLIYTHDPSAAELATIGAFFGGHSYTVWLAELLDGKAVRSAVRIWAQDGVSLRLTCFSSCDTNRITPCP